MERGHRDALTGRTLTSLVERSTVALTSRGPGGADTSLGTGFFIAPDIVATCAHVVAPTLDELPPTVEAEEPATGRRITLSTAKDQYFRQSVGYDLATLRFSAVDGPPAPHVLLSPELEVGDDLWTYGYPDGGFRAGQPANFTFEGWSRRTAAPTVELPRLRGTPVKGGASGSPVLNRRTGAVCGMLIMSDKAGSAHLLSATEILQCCPEARRRTEAHFTTHREWLSTLTDEQLMAGQWSYPSSRLRAYIDAAARASDGHPYRELLVSAPDKRPGQRMPPLSTVYVSQSATDTETRSSVTSGKSDLDPLPASEIFERGDDSILIGPAGAGKSSLLRAATLTSIQRWRRDFDLTLPVRMRADAVLFAGPLPEAIAQSVNAELAGAGADQRWSPDFFRVPPLPNVAWLVLVDGLDEIIDVRQRQAVVDKISGFRESLDAPTHRFIIATRPLADMGLHFTPEWELRSYHLLPFSDSQFQEFAMKWLAYLKADKPDEGAERLLGLLSDSGRDRLFRIPLVAMMICQIYANDPHSPIPSTGIEVYRRFVALLSDRFFESGIKRDLAGLANPFGDQALAAVDRLVVEFRSLVRALAWLHRSDPDGSLTAEAARWTAALRPSQVSEELWRQFLCATLRRTGLLIEYDDDFDFLHESVAEFLAAEHVSNDAVLSRTKFSELLPDRRGDWRAAEAAWQHPFARFLVYQWIGRPELDKALRRVARRGALHGCSFIAALAAEGVELDPRIVAAAVDQLRGLVRAGKDPARRRTAIDVAAMLDVEAGTSMLVALAAQGKASASDRRWAVTRLAAVLQPRTALRAALRGADSHTGSPRWAFAALAGQPGEHGAELMVRLARDRSFVGADRRWAAEALNSAGDPRARGLLARIADDERVADEERRWAAEAAIAAGTSGRRVRARLARLVVGEQVSEVLEPLITIHRASRPRADAVVLQRAFDVSARWHSGQYRKSGDPYITHPLAVATILANLGADTATLVAGLLHDTIKITEYPLDQMRKDFGTEVALLVDGLARVNRVKMSDAAKAETIRKMVVAMAKDPRVLVIKLADRLHNMRTLTFLPRVDQERTARDTLEILAPLAHRLGMNAVKWELEDLAFGTLFPKRFEEINRLIGEHQPQREALLRQVTNRVSLDLKSAKIKAEVTGRPKHLYSIYRKMTVRGRDFNDIYDLVGVRILVDTARDCYAALGVIHANWQPVPGRFKDYVAMPKSNMYQSLHTTVIGPAGKPVEMQIRTFTMHRTAEFGIAAHTKDEEPNGLAASDPDEFLDALRFTLSSHEVYVFTPKGDAIPLPTGSTPVDFAYAVHTDVGHKCIGARVNGKLVPLETTLSNGDVIEIFTSKSASAGPTRDWLDTVRSGRARTRIRQYFNKERREEAIELGKESLVRTMRKQGLPLQRMLTRETLTTTAHDLRLADVVSLYEAVGEKKVPAEAVVRQLVAGFAGQQRSVEDIAETAVGTRPRRNSIVQDPGVVVAGISDAWIKLSRCCTPVPGDAVFGFVTYSGGVSVHRADCASAASLRDQEERVVEVGWKPTGTSTFLVNIGVEALDRRRLMTDLCRALSGTGANILSCTAGTAAGHIATLRFTFEIGGPDQLNEAITAVRRVDCVYDVFRTHLDGSPQSGDG